MWMIFCRRLWLIRGGGVCQGLICKCVYIMNGIGILKSAYGESNWVWSFIWVVVCFLEACTHCVCLFSGVCLCCSGSECCSGV